VRSIRNTEVLLGIYREARELGDSYYEVMLAAAMRLVELNDERSLHPLTLRALALDICDFKTGNAYQKVVAEIDDQETLAEIAKRACFGLTALAAARKIDDQAVLSDVAENSIFPEVRAQTIERITDHTLLQGIMDSTSSSDDYKKAAEQALDEAIRIDDQDTIARIIQSAATEDVFHKAADNLKDRAMVEGLAQKLLENNKSLENDPLLEVALTHINDQAFLWQIVLDRNAEYQGKTRAAAIKRIKNTALLEEIIVDSKQDMLVRQAALEALYHPIALYSVVFRWMTSERFESLFDQAIKKLRSSDLNLLSSVITQAYLWEYRISAWRRIVGFSTVSLEEKKPIFDSFMQSVRNTDKASQLADTIPQSQREAFGLGMDA
jgi:hypothetical protein